MSYYIPNQYSTNRPEVEEVEQITLANLDNIRGAAVSDFIREVAADKGVTMTDEEVHNTCMRLQIRTGKVCI
jgi:hypothetical protein